MSDFIADHRKDQIKPMYLKCVMCGYREEWDGQITGKLCPQCKKEPLWRFTKVAPK